MIVLCDWVSFTSKAIVQIFILGQHSQYFDPVDHSYQLLSCQPTETEEVLHDVFVIDTELNQDRIESGINTNAVSNPRFVLLIEKNWPNLLSFPSKGMKP